MTNLDPRIKACLEAMSPQDRLEAALRLMSDAERGYSTTDVTSAFDARLKNDPPGSGYDSGSDDRDTSNQRMTDDELAEYFAKELAPEPAKSESPQKPVSPADPDVDSNAGVGDENPVMAAEVTKLYLQKLEGIR